MKWRGTPSKPMSAKDRLVYVQQIITRLQLQIHLAAVVTLAFHDFGVLKRSLPSTSSSIDIDWLLAKDCARGYSAILPITPFCVVRASVERETNHHTAAETQVIQSTIRAHQQLVKYYNCLTQMVEEEVIKASADYFFEITDPPSIYVTTPAYVSLRCGNTNNTISVAIDASVAQNVSMKQLLDCNCSIEGLPQRVRSDIIVVANSLQFWLQLNDPVDQFAGVMFEPSTDDPGVFSWCLYSRSNKVVFEGYNAQGGPRVYGLMKYNNADGTSTYVTAQHLCTLTMAQLQEKIRPNVKAQPCPIFHADVN